MDWFRPLGSPPPRPPSAAVRAAQQQAKAEATAVRLFMGNDEALVALIAHAMAAVWKSRARASAWFGARALALLGLVAFAAPYTATFSAVLIFLGAALVMCVPMGITLGYRIREWRSSHERLLEWHTALVEGSLELPDTRVSTSVFSLFGEQYYWPSSSIRDYAPLARAPSWQTDDINAVPWAREIWAGWVVGAQAQTLVLRTFHLEWLHQQVREYNRELAKVPPAPSLAFLAALGDSADADALDEARRALADTAQDNLNARLPPASAPSPQRSRL